MSDDVFPLPCNIVTKYRVLKKANLCSSQCTLFESENEWQKTKQVPIPLPRASRNFPDIKTRKTIFFYNWTSEIILFIHFGKQIDWT